MTTSTPFFLFFLFPVLFLSGQSLSSENKRALRLYRKGEVKTKERDFDSALKLFTKATASDSRFYEAYLRKANLYHRMGMEDSVYTHLGKYLEFTDKPSTSILNQMAKMSFGRGQYDDAQDYLDKLVWLQPDMKRHREVHWLNNSLNFAKSQVARDSVLTLEIVEMPQEINRFTLQYLPAMTIDAHGLYYTKRDTISGDEDIVVSYFNAGKWTEAQSISAKINSTYNEGACAISADGRTLVFTSCDRHDSYGSCDLYVSNKTGKNWSIPRNIGKPINTEYWESQPSLSADGKWLIFSSNRPGGQGNRDLWSSYYLDKTWTFPANMGEEINTFKDETTPFLHPNGETLYFSSNGHPGMGGFDLYKADRIDAAWSEAQNLGVPINTFRDETGLLITSDGQEALFAKEIRKNHEILDSKIVNFQPRTIKTRPASYIIGKVTDAKTGAELRAEIEVYDLKLDTLLYSASSDSINGRYVMTLPPDRELGCYVKRRGYLFYENRFLTHSNATTKPDTINIALRPIEVNQVIVLKNIYFDVDSYDLDEKSKTEIRNIAEILHQNKGLLVEISGHTDNQGKKSYNQQLSENRAKGVYDALRHAGIDERQLTFVGHADRFPIQSNATAEGRKSNRRIEFRVLNIK